MAEQGSPPRRPSRQADPERRSRGERAARPDRPRRSERPDRAAWQAYEAFGPDTDAELPPWATPSSYEKRPGGARQRPAGQPSGRVNDRQADPYADQYADPYAAPALDSGDPAYADRVRPATSDKGGGHRGRGFDDGGYRDGGYDDHAYAGAAGAGGHYRGRRRGPDTLVGDDEEADGGSYEPAGDDAAPEAPGADRGRSGRGRAAATRLRKSRRRVYRWTGMAIVIVLLAAGGVWIFGRSKPASAPWVTNLLAGEYKSVPNACSAVGTSVLNQYLPQPGRTQRVSVGSGTNSQCSYSFDKQPAFLVLEIDIEALQPFAAAGANGSATANAQLALATARQTLARPPKRSPLPPATITSLAGIGQQAFSAIQHEHVRGIGTEDVVTVVIRQRNVLINVSCTGQESGHGFGPVPDATLAACARAAASAVLAKAESEPTA